MLTTNILSCYNHLIATTVLYVTLIDPLQELANSLKYNTDSEYNHVPLTVSATDDPNRDYYEILGVKKDASKQEIHKAFRHMAKKYHPDKNKEKGAQDEFIKIFKAYETLSDEKKRKEYDNRANAGNGSFNGWPSSNGMNDFDMNEFFKQYEDQFLKHAHHFTQHHQAHQHNLNNHHHEHNAHHNHHDQFSFHGVNLDDLFHDIDEDEFSSFGRMFDFSHGHLHHDMDGSFGDGKSFFGSHLPSQIHDTLHNQHIYEQHSSGGSRGGYSCHTTTKQVNGMLMTQTSCG